MQTTILHFAYERISHQERRISKTSKAFAGMVSLCSLPSSCLNDPCPQLKAIGLFLLSIFSRRAEKKVRNIFISKINGGGLALLNELVVDTSGPEIVEVLKLLADDANYPVGIYCTAGERDWRP